MASVKTVATWQIEAWAGPAFRHLLLPLIYTPAASGVPWEGKGGCGPRRWWTSRGWGRGSPLGLGPCVGMTSPPSRREGRARRWGQGSPARCVTSRGCPRQLEDGPESLLQPGVHTGTDRRCDRQTSVLQVYWIISTQNHYSSVICLSVLYLGMSIANQFL